MKTIPNLRLEKSMRINAKEDFKTFRETSSENKIHSAYFLIFSKLNSFDFARMAVIVSKRVSKKAVQRNLIKRIVRETFRKSSLSDIDFLIIAKNQCIHANNETITSDLAKNLLVISNQTLNPSL